MQEGLRKGRFALDWMLSESRVNSPTRLSIYLMYGGGLEWG